MTRYAHSLSLRLVERRAASLGRRAFSLLELMIVVAIIIILVSLTLAVITPVLLKNEERVTRNILAQLDAAVVEFETSVQRRITFRNTNAAPENAGVWDVAYNAAFPATPAAPFNNVNSNQQRYARTAELLKLLGQEPKARDILAKIPTANFGNVKLASPGSGAIHMDAKGVVDAWGTPIVAVFPGRDAIAADGNNKDFDGTIRSVAEDGATPQTSGWGVCRNKLILFVSAGPDLSFYDVTNTPDDERKDNLYSYEPEGK